MRKKSFAYDLDKIKSDELGEEEKKYLEDMVSLQEKLKRLDELEKRDTPMKVKIENCLERCPRCRTYQVKQIEDYYKGKDFNYCPMCGQRLDWSGLNETQRQGHKE
jgi:hypothetical protein